MDGIPSILAFGAVVTSVVLLLVVGEISWARTAWLRRPHELTIAVERAIDTRTSPFTLVPGFAGVLMGASGLIGASAAVIGGRGPPAGWVVLAAAGALVAALGFGARVVRIYVADHGVTVGYGLRRPFDLRWEECSLLAPPRWPMGAWRVSGKVGHHDVACRLMPTDLLGHEFVLGVVAARAGLVFDGRAWNAPAQDRAT
jgi:hypothetical protein